MASENIKILKYVCGNNIGSCRDLHEFFIDTLAHEWTPAIEQFSVLHIEYNGKQYMVLEEVFEDTPEGQIFEVIKTEITDNKKKKFTLTPIGEISDGWYGGTRNCDDAAKDEIVQKIYTWVCDVGSALFEKLQEENPEDFLRADEKSEYEVDEEDQVEEGNVVHAGLAHLKEKCMSDYTVSRDFLDLTTALLNNVTARLLTAMNEMEYKKSQKVPEDRPSVDKYLTREQIEKLGKKELQAAMRDADITMPYNRDSDKKKEALIALFEDLSVTDKLKSNVPKGLKPATVDHLRKAVEVILSGEFVRFALQAIDSQLAKNSWKGLCLPQSFYVQLLSDNGLHPSSDLVLCFAKIVECIIAEIYYTSEGIARDNNMRFLGSTLIKLAISQDSELAALFAELEDKELKANDITKLECLEFAWVNAKGQVWQDEDTRKLKEERNDEEEEEEVEEGDEEEEEEEEEIEEGEEEEEEEEEVEQVEEEGEEEEEAEEKEQEVEQAEEEEEEEKEEEVKKPAKEVKNKGKENDKAAANTVHRRSSRLEKTAKEARRTKAAKVPKQKVEGGQSREDRKFWKAAFA